ncbi:MAG: signal peptidase II [Paracoccaceae bacterium]|jgi:signal peptidase II
MGRFWGIAALAFAIDQISKYAVIYGLDLIERGPVEVFPPLLVFRFGLNTGINFGLFSDLPFEMRWILVALSLGISAAIVIWAKRSLETTVQFACAGLLVGGAMGNAVDRMVHPGVLDFLNMSCCGINNPYVFNLADVFIFAGAIGLAFLSDPKKAT